MASNLLHRLREAADRPDCIYPNTVREAADEIERQAAELRSLRAALKALLPEAINDRYMTQSVAVENARAALGGDT